MEGSGQGRRLLEMFSRSRSEPTFGALAFSFNGRTAHEMFLVNRMPRDASPPHVETGHVLRCS